MKLSNKYCALNICNEYLGNPDFSEVYPVNLVNLYNFCGNCVECPKYLGKLCKYC